MQLSKILKIAGLLALAASSFSAWAADTPATIPASFQGTYDLTYAAESTKGPFANNAKVTLVVMTGNQLCVAGKTLSNPVLRNGNAHEAIWTDSATKVEYALSSLVTGFNEVNVSEGVLFTSSFIFHGQLRGSKTSSATTCSGGSTGGTTPTISTSAQTMFDIAAQVYPTLLVNGSALGLYQGYVYKFFAASGIYVGIKDDIVYTLGGPFGTVIKPQGSVTVVLNALQAAKAKLDAPTTPTPGIPSGLYNLKVTGKVVMMGIQLDIPQITLANMPAPQPTDTNTIIDTVKTSLGATGFANLKVTVINNTASRVTFRVEMTASSQGVNVTYDLTYDYTK